MPRLISNEELDELPADDRPRFAAMEEIMRQRHENLAEQEDSTAGLQRLRRQYFSAVVTAAEELGIAKIANEYVPDASELSDDTFAQFTDKVDGVTLKIAMGASKAAAPYSVRIEGSTKSRLLELTAELRQEVKELHLSPARKDALLARIDQFEKDLEGPRLNFSNMAAMAVLAISLVSDLGGAGATVRDTVNAIQQVVGTAKVEEEVGGALAIAHSKPLQIEGPKAPE